MASRIQTQFKFLIPQEDQNKSGIYRISVEGGSSSYIGSASNFSKRYFEHQRDLVLGQHHCVALQRAWNKYGDAAFSMNIVEFCEPAKEALIDVEQKWIDAEGFSNLYNTSPTAGNTFGTKFNYETRVNASLIRGGIGVPGVTFEKGKWCVRIRRVQIGRFVTKEEAIAAADKYEETGIVEPKQRNNNTSGYTGVYYYKQYDKWQVKVFFNGKGICLGYFDTPEEGNEYRLKTLKKMEEGKSPSRKPFNFRVGPSGYPGVCFYAPNEKWVAKYTKNKKTYHIGYFATPEEANEARIKFIESHKATLTN
jgi:group I intron endonuclease